MQSLADRADVVIADPIDDWLPTRGESVVRVRVTGAVEDPGLAPRDGPVAAFSGMYESPIALSPRFTSLRVPSVAGGLYAAIGVVAALIARGRDGRGQDVSIPLADAVVSVLELNALFTIQAPTRWSPIQWAASPFIKAYPTSDGWLYLHAGMPHHAAKLVEALAPHVETGVLAELLGPEVLERPGCMASPRSAGAIVSALRRIFSQASAETWERRLSEAGLCASVVHSPEAWARHPHPLASGQLVSGPDGLTPGRHVHARGGGSPQPNTPWDGPSAFSTPFGAADDRPPLAGVRVADLSQVIAGPTAARVLAELGAEVERLENRALAAAWVEPFHIAFNAGKSSRWVDADALPDALRAMGPDVVVENFRPGVAERLGVLDALTEGTVTLSISAYGRTGPWGGRPGWEQTAQAAVGMQRDAGGDGAPELCPLPVNDFCTGLSGALAALLGLLERQRGGAGQRVETSLTGTAVQLLADLYTADGVRPDRPRGKSLGWGPERHFYRARDGWAFLEADSVEALASVVGLEGLTEAEDPQRFLAGRLAKATVETWRERLGDSGTIARRRTTRKTLLDSSAWQRDLIRREHHAGVGDVTLAGARLGLERTPLLPLAPAEARGGTSAALVSSGAPSRFAWLLAQVRWALFIVRTR